MELILICTEGESSEPACITEYIRSIDLSFNGSKLGIRVEVLPIGGTCGYIHMVEHANKTVLEYVNNEENFVDEELRNIVLGKAQNSDDFKVTKFAVFDTDKLSESKITLESLKEEFQGAGFIPLANHPNIEGMATLLFSDADQLQGLDPTNIKATLRDKARIYVEACGGLALPEYSKKSYVAKNWFSSVFNYDPELRDRALELPSDPIMDYYSEMSVLFSYLRHRIVLDDETGSQNC